jgi:hypothetical protein
MSIQPTFGHAEVAFPLWPICQKFHRRYVELDDDLRGRSSPAPSELKAYWDTAGERMETATIAIVFAATFLDQFIYKYGCGHFGIEDCEKEFDRLSLRSKWLKIPERAHGKTILETSSAIEMLGELVQVRHRIVHCKVFDMGIEVIPAAQKVESLAKLTHKCARNAVLTTKSLMIELGKIDTGEAFQKFLADFLAK